MRQPTQYAMYAGDLPDKLFFWQVQPEIQSYRLNRDEPAEDDDVEDGVPGFVEWELPSRCATAMHPARLKTTYRGSCMCHKAAVASQAYHAALHLLASALNRRRSYLKGTIGPKTVAAQKHMCMPWIVGCPGLPMSQSVELLDDAYVLTYMPGLSRRV